jgi:hypothetical protein
MIKSAERELRTLALRFFFLQIPPRSRMQELFLQRFLVLAAESGYSRAAKLGDCLSAR